MDVGPPRAEDFGSGALRSRGLEEARIASPYVQSAQLLLLLLAKGSLLRRVTAEWGQTVPGWSGSWHNLGQRLPESLRNGTRPESRLEQDRGSNQRVTLDSTDTAPETFSRRRGLVGERAVQAAQAGGPRSGCAPGRPPPRPHAAARHAGNGDSSRLHPK